MLLYLAKHIACAVELVVAIALIMAIAVIVLGVLLPFPLVHQ